MARRNLVFATGEMYHIFNRSIAKTAIFSGKREIHKAFEILEFYRFPQDIRLSKFKLLPQIAQNGHLSQLKNKAPLVEIYCYAFMPNHYHFLLKQLQDNGVLRFIGNLQNSYAKYFNLRTDRDGGLFQNPFKAKYIETESQFLHLSRYIHLNPVTAYLIEFDELANYPWTSFPHYVNGVDAKRSFVNTELLLGMVGSKESYREFVADRVSYQRELAMIKELLME